MTKNITPISIWYNGNTTNAVKILVRGVHDDLDAQAIYYYELIDASEKILTVGNLTLIGTAYQNRTDNQYVWDWVATQLTLTYVT